MHTGEEYVRRAAGRRQRLPLEGRGAGRAAHGGRDRVRGEVFLSPAVSKHLVSAFVRGEQGQESSLVRLSPRLREVLQLLAEGHRTKKIAHILNISVRTVESHRAQLMDDLGIHDLPGLVKYAIRMGLVPPE